MPQAAALTLLALALAPLMTSAQDLQRHGEVTAVDGQEVTVQLSEGLSVSSGTAGTIYTTTTVGGEERSVRVAQVEVTEIEGRTVTVRVTNQTQAPQTGFLVAFETVQRLGTLVVETEPAEAVVTIDGQQIGRGTIRQQLPPGEHEVAVQAGGYQSARRVVTVAPEETQELTFALRSARGKLLVEAVPDSARILVGGNVVGEGRFADNLPPGEYSVGIRAQSYVPIDTTVAIRTGETTRIEDRLERKTGQVVVATQPNSARVFLDGELVGEAPIIEEVAYGPHDVRVEANGYRTAVDSVSVNRQPSQVSISLKRKQRLATIQVSPASDTLVAGESLRLNTEGRSENGRQVPSPTVQFSVSPSSVASVSEEGVLRVSPDASEEEVKVVAATPTGVRDEALIQVKPAVQRVEVRPSEETVTVGNSFGAEITVQFKDGSQGQGANVTWKSSRPTVASVSEGTVLGESAGRATIMATLQGYSDELEVQVRRPVVSLKVLPGELTFLEGTRFTFQATPRDESGRELDRSVEWLVRDPSIASVGPSGTVEAKKPGETVLVARSGDVSMQVPIHVESPGIGAGSAFFSGLLFPGLGNYRAGQVGFGLLVTAAAGGGAAVGLLSKRTTEFCTVRASSDCPPNNTLRTKGERHLLVPGLAAAGGAMLIGAIAAAMGAGKDDLPRPSVAVEISEGVKAPLALNRNSNNLGITLLTVNFDEALSER
jgi:hypothetical protein